MGLTWQMPPRSTERELLELGDGADDEVRHNLAEMSWFNRWLGGRRSLKKFLLPRLRSGWKVVDAGCGGGGLLRFVSRWASQRGLDVQLIGLDQDRRNLAVAREILGPEAWLVAGDLTQMPFRDGSVEGLYSTLVLHHLDPLALQQAVAESARISSRIAVLNDLVRDRLALLFFRATAPLLARCRLTRYDGDLSIRRAYTPKELGEQARQAGLVEPKVKEDLLFRRMTLAVVRDS
jgi:ubiquinone/menaquinone biosynthesis C-methylase UbiE